jgi:membrane-bound lytic murein transglycosylase B
MSLHLGLQRYAAHWQHQQMAAWQRRRRSVLALGVALTWTVAGAATAEVPARPTAAPSPAEALGAAGTMSGPSGTGALSSRWGDEAQRTYPDPVLAGVLEPPASPTTIDAVLAAIDPRVDISGIPVRVLDAYRAAADRLAKEQPACALPWEVLAGIGKVESGHGTYGGAAVDVNGRATPEIIGLRLDGAGPVAEIRDTDGGRYDRDLEYDRAVGPMQFIPSTWARYGADADGDGRTDPHDIDDVALAAGRYLCASGSFASPAASVRAVFAYNHSYEYVRLVLSLAAAYAGRTPESLGIDLLPPPAAPSPAPAGPVPPPAVLAAPAPPPAPPATGKQAPPPAATAQQAPAATEPVQQPAAAPAPIVAQPEPAPGRQPATSPTAAPAPIPEPPPGPSPEPTPCPTGSPAPEPSGCIPAPSPEPTTEPSVTPTP